MGVDWDGNVDLGDGSQMDGILWVCVMIPMQYERIQKFLLNVVFCSVSFTAFS